ncbi:hypothetical protein NHX12_030087 [Muraenolepis orangiensis]|uniref:Uncharacterized protein n=1 Tax=Muraenolepis orangiensis TaxID=630683 RepID=A0A9Q0EB25_9TELE|nr:hypothetical protein NHX12_030087 [Muraenolepis orangiensis]
MRPVSWEYRKPAFWNTKRVCVLKQRPGDSAPLLNSVLWSPRRHTAGGSVGTAGGSDGTAGGSDGTAGGSDGTAEIPERSSALRDFPCREDISSTVCSSSDTEMIYCHSSGGGGGGDRGLT